MVINDASYGTCDVRHDPLTVHLLFALEVHSLSSYNL